MAMSWWTPGCPCCCPCEILHDFPQLQPSWLTEEQWDALRPTYEEFWLPTLEAAGSVCGYNDNIVDCTKAAWLSTYYWFNHPSGLGWNYPGFPVVPQWLHDGGRIFLCCESPGGNDNGFRSTGWSDFCDQFNLAAASAGLPSIAVSFGFGPLGAQGIIGSGTCIVNTAVPVMDGITAPGYSLTVATADTTAISPWVNLLTRPTTVDDVGVVSAMPYGSGLICTIGDWDVLRDENAQLLWQRLMEWPVADIF